MKAIDLFCGAGGLSLGLRRSGWQVLASIEKDRDSIQTYTNNFHHTLAIETDVRKVDFSQFKGIDLVAGGPPCQPFSVAGKRLAGADSRDMVPEFLRALKESESTAFVMENVPGLLSKKNKPYVERLVRSLRDIGYSCLNFKILNAAEYGVPQNRKRVFFVGFRNEVSFQFPEVTHGKGHDLLDFVSVREALMGVPECLPNNSIVTYAKKPVLRKSPWAGMYLNGKGRPMNLDEPAPTIPASAGGNRTHIIDEQGILKEYHSHLVAGGLPRTGMVSGVRRLTVRESARLQSFPDDFFFSGSRSSKYRQIGNAVPPVLAEKIGVEIMLVLEKGSGR